MDILDDIMEFFTGGTGLAVLRAAIVLTVGLVVASLAGRATQRFAHRYTDLQRAMLARRIVYYGILVMTLISMMNELGFSLTVLLGAAGVLSVAIGFASQTSASNLISGLFLIGEKPFVIGDVITVGTTTGEVLTLDLMSVKLRTYDNLYVRIPNETLIKSHIFNLTRFPIRRFDLTVSVAYKEDLDQVYSVLLGVAEDNPLSLQDPAPMILFLGYGSSSIDLQFSVWTRRENWLEMKKVIPVEVKRAFDREGIEIPFPHLSLYAGEATKPIPLAVKGPSGR